MKEKGDICYLEISDKHNLEKLCNLVLYELIYCV